MNRLMTASSLSRCCLVALLIGAGSTAQKPPIRINSDPAQVGEVNLPVLAESDGVTYAAWNDNRSGSWAIRFSRSEDRGATWLTSDVPVGPASMLVGPRIVAVGSFVFVCWIGDELGGYRVSCNVSHDRGATWMSSPLRVDAGSAMTQPPDRLGIAYAAGRVHVTWDDDGGGTLDDVVVRSWRIVENDWLGPSQVVGSGSEPRVFATDQAVHVFWLDSGLDYRRSADGGVTFESAADLVPPGPIAEFDCVAIGGSVHVAWIRISGSAADVYHRRSQDSGASWSGPIQRVSDPSVASARTFLRIAAAEACVYVGWTDSRDAPLGSIYVRRSTDFGNSWGDLETRITDDPTTTKLGLLSLRYLTALVAEADTVHVAWDDSREFGFAFDTFYQRSDDYGASWLESDVALGSGAAFSSTFPQMVLVEGAVGVAWGGASPLANDVSFTIASGVQPYGAGGAGASGAVPEVDASGFAMVGGELELELTHSVSLAPSALLIGFEASSRIALPLLGGTLLVNPATSVAMTTEVDGSWVMPLGVPDAQQLLGLNVNCQVWVLDRGALSAFAHSNGIEVWLN